MSLGNEIREVRRQRGWSQSALAERAGVSRPTIARVELGHDVSTATLVKVAAALSLKVALNATEDSAQPTGDVEPDRMEEAEILAECR